jgi:hypothetical protein
MITGALLCYTGKYAMLWLYLGGMQCVLCIA